MEISNYKSRVLLVDDHAIFLEGVKSLLRRNEKIEIIGTARDGQQAKEMLEQTAVDLLITDINMPKLDGMELTRIAKASFPSIKVLVLTVFGDGEVIREIMRTDAEGYLLKSAGRREFFAAIDQIIDGGTYYSKKVLSSLMQELESLNNTDKTLLTPREQEILSLVCEELSSHQIADRLFISPRTVETHRKNIMAKTESKSIVGLIRYAFTHGFVSL